MIVLGEHFGYKKNKNRFELSKSNLDCCIVNNLQIPFVKPFNNNENTFCFKFNKSENEEYQFETGYYIGVDWIGDSGLSINVQPKLNTEDKEIDYLKILFEALQEPTNFKHLKNLYTIDFKASLIEIEQHQDKLTPLLLLEFLQLLKQIVRKGLKKSYYKVTKNLNARVKGKVLVNATVKQNHTKHKMLYNVCQYEEFGYNSIENRILKKALLFTQSALNNLKGTTIDFKHLFHYVNPAFQLVDANISIRELKNTKPNPLFKEYTQALKLAKIILKKYGYNISKTTETKIKTPPFWIDMTKLFELYVYKKLREIFPNKNEVKHHYTTNSQELDYLINSKDKNIKMVVDAKYKNRYIKGGIGKDDARQISGYARLKSVYKELNITNTREVIDCLIVYPNQNLNENFNFANQINNPKNKYVHLYKAGIKLPYVL